jgi:hypothetical protein
MCSIAAGCHNGEPDQPERPPVRSVLWQPIPHTEFSREAYETIAEDDRASREAAVRAFKSGSGSVRLSLGSNTEEGDSVYQFLEVEEGKARLILDSTEDRYGSPVIASTELEEILLGYDKPRPGNLPPVVVEFDDKCDPALPCRVLYRLRGGKGYGEF